MSLRPQHARRRPRGAGLPGTVIASIAGVAGAWAVVAFGPANAATPFADDSPLASAVAADPGAQSGPATEDTASIGPITAPSVDANIGAAPELSVDLWSRHSIDEPESPWVVTNKTRPVNPIDYAPPELDTVAGVSMVPEAAAAMTRMRAAAADAGAAFSLSNAYRSYGKQSGLYSTYVANLGRALADRGSMRPGYSEHQTGWSADAYSSAACRIKACFADEPAGRWLAEHAHEFGFIVRYPSDAQDITGIRYEPWHVRYVGEDLAAELVTTGLTMEEFFDLPAAPDYE
ncbi:M15 family metallopeptidase [Demequina globuliformis]|uniref:M15 family metallopeptidase n=1 Tax=Demequina globuliformis TaxID=676202 RepID=UPI000784E8BC|nr:M15 family metallopeptidase [Demequina globuliformis]